MRPIIIYIVCIFVYGQYTLFPQTLNYLNFPDKLNSISSNLGSENFNGFIYSKSSTEKDSGKITNSRMKPLEWYTMFSNLPGDMVSFYKEDITMKKVPLYLCIAATTAGLILTDDATWKASDKFYRHNSFNKNASDFFVNIGDGKSQFGLAGAFAVFGFLDNNQRALRTASEIVEAVLASGAVVQLLKHLTGRESPFVSTKEGGRWRIFPNQIQYHKHVPAFDAFPSGHLATSLAAFVVIADNYPEYKWITPVSYTLEGLLAVGMVNQGIHWYSDYPLAIFLGYTFGKIVSSHSVESSSIGREKFGISFEPIFAFRFSGIGITVKW